MELGVEYSRSALIFQRWGPARHLYPEGTARVKSANTLGVKGSMSYVAVAVTPSRQQLLIGVLRRHQTSAMISLKHIMETDGNLKTSETRKQIETSPVSTSTRYSEERELHLHRAFLERPQSCDGDCTVTTLI